MLERLEQFLNALLPMLVTLSGIVMLVRLEQPEKALLPMLVTAFPLYSDGMTTVAGILLMSLAAMLYVPSSSSVNVKYSSGVG